jgi:hypothetical protein
MMPWYRNQMVCKIAENIWFGMSVCSGLDYKQCLPHVLSLVLLAMTGGSDGRVLELKVALITRLQSPPLSCLKCQGLVCFWDI